MLSTHLERLLEATLMNAGNSSFPEEEWEDSHNYDGLLPDNEMAAIDFASGVSRSHTPVARVISTDQSGKTAIVELLPQSVPLEVGSILFARKAPES